MRTLKLGITNRLFSQLIAASSLAKILLGWNALAYSGRRKKSFVRLATVRKGRVNQSKIIFKSVVHHFFMISSSFLFGTSKFFVGQSSSFCQSWKTFHKRYVKQPRIPCYLKRSNLLRVVNIFVGLALNVKNWGGFWKVGSTDFILIKKKISARVRIH